MDEKKDTSVEAMTPAQLEAGKKASYNFEVGIRIKVINEQLVKNYNNSHTNITLGRSFLPDPFKTNLTDDVLKAFKNSGWKITVHDYRYPRTRPTQTMPEYWSNFVTDDYSWTFAPVVS